MLTTFVRSAGNRTKELWYFIDEASRADVMLADRKKCHDQENAPFLFGQGSDFGSPIILSVP